MPRHLRVALVGALALFAVGAAPRARIAAPERVRVAPRAAFVELGVCDVVVDTVTVIVPPRGYLPAVDVYLLADTTGSMEPVLDAVQEGAAGLVDRLRAELPGVDLRFGVGAYRDFPTEAFAFDHQLAPTADRAAILDAIDGWEADAGGDAPEGQLFALDRLAHGVDAEGGPIGWSRRAERIVVWLGDAPGHDPICPEISGLSATIDEGSVTEALVEAGIGVVAISTLTGYALGLDDDPTRSTWSYAADCDVRGGSPGQATRITAATGGTYVDDVAADAIIDTIVAGVADQAGTIGRLELVPSASLAPFVADVSDPVGPLDPTRREEVDFEVRYVGDVACEDEDQVFRGTLNVRADSVQVAVQHVWVTIPACVSRP